MVQARYIYAGNEASTSTAANFSNIKGKLAPHHADLPSPFQAVSRSLLPFVGLLVNRPKQ